MSKSQTLDHKDIAQKQPFPKLMFDMGYFVKFRLHIKIIFQCKKGSSFFIKCYVFEKPSMVDSFETDRNEYTYNEDHMFHYCIWF